MRPERVRGAILGALVGDALGVPYEFHDPADLPEHIGMEPPEGFSRAHRGVPPGTYSDDGAQLLCLLESLLAHPTFSHDDFAARLSAWFDRGHLAVDGVVFDVGVQTRLALSQLTAGVPPLEAGPAHERTNGNGSLMRVLPVAFFGGSDEDRIRIADLSSRITHGHARSRVACQLYVLWARRVLEDVPSPYVSAARTLEALLPRDSEEREAFELHLRPFDASPGHGSGYVVDALRSARAVMDAASSFEDAALRAIRLGDDTDTTACLVGGIAGAKWGEEAIPERWRMALRGDGLWSPLVTGLVERLR
jgi:ADP-ribosylglycohydrolase